MTIRPLCPRILALSTLVSVLCLGGCASTAQQPSTVAPKAAPASTVVVFLQGVCSSLPEQPNSAGPLFGPVENQLERRYHFAQNSLLDYSYRGGKMVQSSGIWTWSPASYQNSAPIQTNYETDGYSALNGMLLAYHAKYPAARFVLVGHSLGGVVAFQEVLSKDPQSAVHQGLVAGVITIDSPLQGVNSDEDNSITHGVLKGSPCLWNGVSDALLRSLWTDEMATSERIQDVHLAEDAGVAVINIGNYDDCLWFPRACGLGLTGSGSTQWLLRSKAKVDQWTVDPKCSVLQTPACFISSHRVVLASRADDIAAEIAGASGAHATPPGTATPTPTVALPTDTPAPAPTNTPYPVPTDTPQPPATAPAPNPAGTVSLPYDFHAADIKPIPPDGAYGVYTPSFTVSGNWTLQWSFGFACGPINTISVDTGDPSTQAYFNNGNPNYYREVDHPLESGGPSTGSVTEHGPGTFWLAIYSPDCDFDIKVSE